MLSTHPLKQVLNNELHSRQFPRILGNVAVSQVTLIHTHNKAEQQAHLALLANAFSVAPPDPNSSCFYRDLGEIDIRWEYHTEFSSYTFIGFNIEENGLDAPPWEKLSRHWKQSIPGEIISAVHLYTFDSRDDVSEWSFANDNVNKVTKSKILNGGAELITRQTVDEQGFEYIRINRNGLCLEQTGRLIRCALELFSYRMMALMSLPTCRKLLPGVTQMEEKLAAISLQLSDVGLRKKASFEIQTQLAELSASLESTIANYQFRLEASLAYFQIIENRLTELTEDTRNNTMTLAGYLNRRLIPAKTTCESIKYRMLNLSERIEKVSDLMRTQISLELECQNQSILKAIERRTSAQFRMQQLVESVSIVAVSYYLIQLLGYMIILPKSLQTTVSEETIIALAVPVVLVSVWLSFKRLRRFFDKVKMNSE